MCRLHTRSQRTMWPSYVAVTRQARVASRRKGAGCAQRTFSEAFKPPGPGGSMIGSLLAQVNSLKEAGSAAAQTQDSAILSEQFYFFTVVIMWLIHAGFMSYETGIARKKNALATAMKNILTIAVVTPTFYYFGWWIYNCNQPGLPIGPNSSDMK